MERQDTQQVANSTGIGWLEAGTVVADGGMGTELIRRAPGATCPSCWRSMEQPAVVEAVHRDYIEAGSTLILSNTFDANRLMLTRGNCPHDVIELNRQAVAVARRAAGSGVVVLGDIGSTGFEEKLLLGGGGQSAGEVAKSVSAAFREQAEILADAGVDGILIETMSYLREAVLAVRAAVQHTRLSVFCTMSFQVRVRGGKPEFRTYWGDPVEKIVGELTEAGARGLGANCGDLVEEMPALVDRMRQFTSLPLFFQINAGKPELNERHETSYNLGPAPWSRIAAEVVARGANVIGGCCGTTPGHIAALRERLASAGV